MIDPRDRCGCHRGCTSWPAPPHVCEVPCRWPECLPDDEAQALADEVLRDHLAPGVAQSPDTV